MSLRLITLLVLLPSPVFAQHAFEIVGTRALGMGGAFVGVADDASAIYWNPAGLLNGPAAGAQIGWEWFQVGNRDLPPFSGPRSHSARLNSLGTWPLGLSYARFQTSTLQEGPDGQIVADTLVTSQWGVTVLQTLVPGLVVGSTLKYLRGRYSSAPVDAATVDEALDLAADLEGDTDGAFDADLGFMADFYRVRLGVVLKNLRSPTFADVAGNAITLERHARFGLAVLPADGVTLAMDLDLDTVDLRDGLRRNLAFGGETRLASRLFARAGVRWSIEGARRLVTTVGGSVAVRTSLWIDGYFAHGADEATRGFGVAFRAAY
jgi:hypothetical protein